MLNKIALLTHITRVSVEGFFLVLECEVCHVCNKKALYYFNQYAMSTALFIRMSQSFKGRSEHSRSPVYSYYALSSRTVNLNYHR